MDVGGKLHAISARQCVAGLGVIGTKCMTQERVPNAGKVETCICNTELCNGSQDEQNKGKNQ